MTEQEAKGMLVKTERMIREINLMWKRVAVLETRAQRWGARKNKELGDRNAVEILAEREPIFRQIQEQSEVLGNILASANISMGVSRQRRHQLLAVVEGRCTSCGKEREANRLMCQECQNKANRLNYKRRSQKKDNSTTAPTRGAD